MTVVRIVLGVTAILAASCSHKEPPVAVVDEPAWRAQLVADRAEQDRLLKTAPASMFAAIDRFLLTGTGHLAIDGSAPRIDTQRGPATLVTFQPTDPTHWTWQPVDPAVTATSSDEKRPLAPGALSEPMLIRLSARFHVGAVASAGGLVLTVYDAQRPELVAFKQLAYFAPDPKFVVAAEVHRLAPPVAVTLTTNRGLQKPYLRYATLRFQLEGRPYELTAFRPAGTHGPELFIPFRDATSGKTTYGAARFLDAEEPGDPDAPITLDFNRAFNPYCAYSPGYNCPLPPSENQLAVAINAGEQQYGH
jgi:uncharacterized protein (DUF1684 family)